MFHACLPQPSTLNPSAVPSEDVIPNPVTLTTGSLLCPHGSSPHASLPHPCSAKAPSSPTDDVKEIPVNETLKAPFQPSSPHASDPHPASLEASAEPKDEVIGRPVRETVTTSEFHELDPQV